MVFIYGRLTALRDRIRRFRRGYTNQRPREVVAKEMKGIKLLESGNYQARYYAGRDLDGSRVYPTRTFTTEEDALAWYQERKRARAFEPEPPPRQRAAFPEGWAKKNFSTLKGAAKHRKIAFGLTFTDFEFLLDQSGGFCMLTGIAFDFQRGVKRRRRPFAPSIDRIDSRGGYTLDNCRVVCCAVNYALGDWGVECLMRIARNLVAREVEVMEKERTRIAKIPAPYVPVAQLVIDEHRLF